MTTTQVAPRAAGRRRGWYWIGLALVAITVVATVTAWLTTPRPGGRMDPSATSADGAHALVTLLRERGVDVVVANTTDQALAATRPDSLLLIAQTYFIGDDAQLRELAEAPGDLLLLEPTPSAREVLTPKLRLATELGFGVEPDCDLREARRAGVADLGAAESYTTVDDEITLTRCYGGRLVRYRDGDRTVTVLGSAEPLTNGGLLSEGNAALALNLAGTAPRLIWYAPQTVQGENPSPTSIFELIPPQVDWIVWQLWLVVGLVALWRGRRLGPLVAEKLPVVVRASETVEGRGRLYRSRRARGRAADALRTAALQRLTPRLGLSSDVTPAGVATAVAARGAGDPETLWHTLFGPAPTTDAELLDLARNLDDIERQVAQS
ncbi:MAG: DUF4350 domain-containing protein [Mycobacterium sp.]|nr:DUF4350 domain-containing protein [Mycobacterium sp.]